MKRKLKIVYCINDLKTGGSEKQLVALANNMSKNGHKVILATISNREEILKELSDNIKFYSLNISHLLSLFNIIKVIKFIVFLMKQKPDILHSFLFNPNILCRICGTIARVPVIISGQRSTDKWRKYYHIILDKITYSLSDTIVANSYSSAKRLIEIEHIPKKHIKIIQNSIIRKIKGDPKYIFEEYNIPKNSIVIGTAGRICYVKDQSLLIRSSKNILKENSNVYLMIIGDGDKLNELKELVKSYNIENKVIFTGNVNNIEDHIAGLSLFVLCSKWEGFANVILETMYQNKCVFSTRTGDADKILKNEFLFNDELEILLFKFIKDPEKYYKKALNYSNYIENNFSFEKSVKKHEELYLRCLERKRKSKILHIITVSESGGATENTLITVQGLSKKYNIEVAALKSETDVLFKECKKYNIKTYPLKYMRRNISLLNDMLCILELYNIIRKNKYSIVHTHSSKAGIIGRIAAYLAGTPIIIHTIHGLSFHHYQNYILHFIYAFSEYIVGKLTDFHITVAKQVKNKAFRYGLNKITKIGVIRSSINFNKFNTIIEKREKNLKYEKIVIGMVGRLVKLKGFEYFIKLISDLKKDFPNIKGIIIGDGPLYKQLKDYTFELNISSNIEFKGYCQNVAEEIVKFDILVHTSLLEGLPRTVVEGFLCKVPVVAFCVDATAEALGFGKRGECVKPLNSDHLYRKTKKIILNYKNYDKKILKAEKWARKNYAKELMINKIDKLYNKFLRIS